MVDLGHAHVLGMAEVVKEDELARPMGVVICGVGRVMLQVGLVAKIGRAVFSMEEPVLNAVKATLEYPL